jgi:hypothetical protein
MSNGEYKWIGKMPENILAFATKKAIKRNPLDMPVRVQFRFGISWCLLDCGKLKLSTGESIEVFQSCLITKGRVMGIRDLNTANGTQYESEWRGAFAGRTLESLKD